MYGRENITVNQIKPTIKNYYKLKQKIKINI